MNNETNALGMEILDDLEQRLENIVRKRTVITDSIFDNLSQLEDKLFPIRCVGEYTDTSRYTLYRCISCNFEEVAK